MIGVFDYTVILTYLSLLSAGTGIVVALSGSGHPYIGVFFLLICGLCDAFDGKVARMKPNRTAREIAFGIQIDSLSDLVAFGVLPACIGAAMFRTSPFLTKTLGLNRDLWYCVLVKYILFAILIVYILAALIRLAWFNVTEEERQRAGAGARMEYTGLPVTSSALIFPSVLLIRYLIQVIFEVDFALLYFFAVILVGYAFVARFKVKKPGLRGILIMIAVGAAEFLILAFLWSFFQGRVK